MFEGVNEIHILNKSILGKQSLVNVLDQNVANWIVLATDNEVWDIRYIVTEAFDGTPTLECGVAGDTDALGTIDLTASTDVLQIIDARYKMTTSEAVNLTYSAGGATTGNVDVYVNRMVF